MLKLTQSVSRKLVFKSHSIRFSDMRAHSSESGMLWEPWLTNLCLHETPIVFILMCMSFVRVLNPFSINCHRFEIEHVLRFLLSLLSPLAHCVGCTCVE